MRPYPALILPFVAFLAACGEDTSRQVPQPPPGLESRSPDEIRGSVTAALPEGVCEQVTGELFGRPELHGALLTIEPQRQVLVLYGEDGALRFYRDQTVGRTGYTVRLDMDADSGWVMDRATRTVAKGRTATLAARADFGPPMALADEVRRRCGVPAAR